MDTSLGHEDDPRLRSTSLAGVHVLRIATARRVAPPAKRRFATRFHLAGCTEWSVRGRRWSSGPGTLDLKLPGERHDEHARTWTSRFQVVAFDDALLGSARDALDCRYVPPCENALDGADPRIAPIVALHARLLDATASALDLEDTLALALCAIAELTSAARPRARHGTRSAAVARARALLDERFTGAVSLDELAVHARLDKFHLARAFRAEVGLAPHAYVTHRRIALARSLLAGGVAQAEVAASVGFYDQSQLHRHFKRILGVTPGEYARATR